MLPTQADSVRLVLQVAVNSGIQFTLASLAKVHFVSAQRGALKRKRGLIISHAKINLLYVHSYSL